MEKESQFNGGEAVPGKNKEREQSREEIVALLEKAAEQHPIVNLVMINYGKEESVLGLYVVEVEGDIVWISFVEADGSEGAEAPVELRRIKHVSFHTTQSN